jgi:hypothetical protein
MQDLSEPLGDRLFGTYRAEPELGTDRLEFGLEEFRDKAAQRPDRMLWQPLLVRRTWHLKRGIARPLSGRRLPTQRPA